MKPHYIHLYYGTGKGKTTAALGLALRAMGQDRKAIILQWMKGRTDIGEFKIGDKLSNNFEIHQFGPKHFTWESPGSAEHKRLALVGLEFLEEIIDKHEYDLLVLDEIVDAVAMKFIPKAKTLDLIKRAAEKGEVIITGHEAVPEFVELADLVTEMRKVKHYFDKGQIARKGIEY